MDDMLIEELYRMADNYHGRIRELIILAIAKIQRLEKTVSNNKHNTKIIEDINIFLEHDNSDKSSVIKDIIKKGQEKE
jgi:hypothetical protein